MSDCGCATPPPPAEYPIASSDCACGLPEAFRAAQTYAEETNAKLARLWPYSEMYGPILRGLRQGRAAGQREADGPEYRRMQSLGSPSRGLEGLLSDGEDDAGKVSVGELPDRFYQPPYGAAPPSASGCEGWRYLGLAAPLFDPLAGTIAGCTGKDYLGWWLNATSPATVSMGDTKRRIYVHNASLMGSDLGMFPSIIEDASNNSITKFPPDTESFGLLVSFWKAQGYSETHDVRDLHFSSQFVAFLDSNDGLQYPVLAPIVLSTNPSNPCDFGYAMGPTYSPLVMHSAGTSFRSGWRSTIVPCAGADVVYQVDSVLRVCHERQPLYLLFAVQCSGHYNHATGTVESGVNCVPCNPCSDEQGDYTPVTRYVMFACRDADFQQRVFGPFDLQDSQAIPDAAQDQWIGVPQAFQSPDGELLFLYLISRGTGRTASEGLWVAQMDRFLGELSLLMQLSPAQGPAPLQEDPTRQSLGQRHLAPTFAPLGALSICAFNAPVFLRRIVDEHFVFCEERLHLYFTYLTEEMDRAGNVSLHLRSFRHCSARSDFRSVRVAAVTPTSDGSVPKPAVVQLALDMCTNFELTRCAPLDTDAVFGAGTTVVSQQNADGSITRVNAELNDPTVFPARPEDIEHGQPGQRMVMLFGSSALRGLAVAASDSACNLGICT